MIGIPLAIWILSSLYFRLFSFKAGKGSAWEINRQTGMITVYKEEQGKRIAYTKPFYEFDAYIVNLPTHQGIIRYQFALKHRYEDLVIGNLFSSGAFDSEREGWPMWYFIQNYMDISHPLPDEGSLEMFRHLDPTTAQYDQQIGRNPRYWRDMTYNEWKQACYQMGDKIAALPLGGKPDLMTQYVDYSNAKSFATRE